MKCELSRQGQRRTKQFGHFKQWGNEAIFWLGRHQRKGHWSETWQYDKTNPNLPWYHWTLSIGLLISSLWMWDFPLCSHPGMWSSSPEYQICFPTFNTRRNSCAKGDGSSFDNGNYMLTKELFHHPWFLPKLAWTSWDMAFSVRSKQVTDFRLQSHSGNCEHWLSCGKIRLKRKLQNGPFPSLCYLLNALLWH